MNTRAFVIALFVLFILISCAPANEVANEYEKYYEEGLKSIESREFDKAIVSLTTAINIDPENTLAYLQRTRAYRYVYEYEKALQDIDKVLEIDPDNYDAHFLRGLLLSDIKRYDDAINAFTFALELSNENKEALFHRGFAHSNIREYKLAIDDFQQYLIYVPDTPNRERIEAMIESLETKIGK
ncbi:MAG: hypothetical protein MHPDNHAH_02964 [Anaerolineales bacterium]|nr:hypothetical protein [Anaerolineales bacterium]WKZ48697.1 MAG: tetratricopeptide repeat protein [Anaerolineales bacterium]